MKESYYVKLPLTLLKSDITSNELKILMLFASYNNNGKLCYLSFENIAEATNQDKRNTRRAINKLIEKGLVKVERLTFENYKNPVNAYRITWQETEEAKEITEEQAKKGHKKSKQTNKQKEKRQSKTIHEVPEWWNEYEENLKKQTKQEKKDKKYTQEEAKELAEKLFGGN